MLTAQKYSNSRKDELMVNLKAAALACGVVATCLGGGLGVAYVNSTKVCSAEIIEESDVKVSDSNEAISQTVENSSSDNEKATSNIKVTTSIVATPAEDNTEASSMSEKSGNNESSTKEISIAVSTAKSTAASAAKVTVPAPVHAPVTKVSETEPITETQTETATEYTVTTAESVTAPIPPSTEALTQSLDSDESSSLSTAPTDTSGTSVVSTLGAGNLTITDEEYIILCNAVANEAGSDWISVDDKAKVVEVIMNRVSSERFPNTIYGVLAQPYQFDGAYNYINLGSFSKDVTDGVIEAVDLYFSNTEAFSEGYMYFYGDGYQNHFYQ